MNDDLHENEDNEDDKDCKDTEKIEGNEDSFINHDNHVYVHINTDDVSRDHPTSNSFPYNTPILSLTKHWKMSKP